MTLEQELRSWLRRYLRNEIPFEVFEDWFVDATWNVHGHGTETVQLLTSTIERLIGEYTSGARTEAQMKRALRGFAPSWWATPRVRSQPGTFAYGVIDDRPPIQSSAAVGDRAPQAVHD